MRSTFWDYLMASSAFASVGMAVAVALGIASAWMLLWAIGIGGVGVAAGLKSANDAPLNSDSENRDDA